MVRVNIMVSSKILKYIHDYLFWVLVVMDLCYVMTKNINLQIT